MNRISKSIVETFFFSLFFSPAINVPSRDTHVRVRCTLREDMWSINTNVYNPVISFSFSLPTLVIKM